MVKWVLPYKFSWQGMSQVTTVTMVSWEGMRCCVSFFLARINGICQTLLSRANILYCIHGTHFISFMHCLEIKPTTLVLLAPCSSVWATEMSFAVQYYYTYLRSQLYHTLFFCTSVLHRKSNCNTYLWNMHKEENRPLFSHSFRAEIKHWFTFAIPPQAEDKQMLENTKRDREREEASH